MTRDSMAPQFFLWLMEDVHGISAEVGSPRDKQLEEFSEHGFIKLNDCHFGNNYYILTDACQILEAIRGGSTHTSPVETPNG